MKKGKYKPIQMIGIHRADCLCVHLQKGDWMWENPHLVTGWGEHPIRRDLSGRNHPRAGHSWLAFDCNDSRCLARLIIYWPHAAKLLGLSDPKLLQRFLI